MKFPDPNIGYLFGYESRITGEGIMVVFLGGLVRILFKYKDIESIRKETYLGGRISWDVVRWGRCPPGKEALRITLKKGILRNNLIVFDDPDEAACELKNTGLLVD
ncbi:MAG: hypothetical protein WAX07_00690 [Candidatus Altiarchaeia archaeon]